MEGRMETIRQHTSDQKKEASELLFYEVTMLHDLSCNMERLLNQNTILGTAALEAFSVHAKVLHDFFYSQKASQNDVVVAQDFFESSGDWDQLRSTEPELLRLAAQRLGDHVARFTYDCGEVVPLLKGWDYCEIATEIQDAFVQFINAVPAKYLGPHCAEFKHHEREDL
jgi:hypothetical protein